MIRKVIAATSRSLLESMRIAMQGDSVRAVVELICNSDDSYRIQEQKSLPADGTVEIIYEKGQKSLNFVVRDFAHGMTHDKVLEAFGKYGEDTSGMRQGMKVRGRFGHGAKDALLGLGGGKICTICDGLFVEGRLFVDLKEHKPILELEDPVKATPQIRKKYGISKNGTLVFFTCEYEHIPRFDRIHEELQKHYMLRKILTNPNRKVLLYDGASASKSKRIKYHYPKILSTITDTFVVPFKGVDYKVEISLHKAPEGLTNSGDDREGGILLLDEEDVVLGVSMFKFDNDPVASHFFGEARVYGFRDLELKETVLSNTRDGLLARHPFNKALITEFEKRLEKVVQDEKAQAKPDVTKKSREDVRRYNRALDLANQIIYQITKEKVNRDGTGGTGTLEGGPVAPENGMRFDIKHMTETVGKPYTSCLIIDTKKIHHGDVINLTCNNPLIEFTPSQIVVTQEDGTGVLSKWFSFTCDTANISGVLTATDVNNGISADANIAITPETESTKNTNELKEYGLVFDPASMTLKPGQTKVITIKLYDRKIPNGAKVLLESDNDKIELSQKSFTFNNFDAVKHIVIKEIEITGNGLGEQALITATVQGEPTLGNQMEVSVTNLGPKKKSKFGVFTDIVFDPSPNPTDDVAFSAHDGRVIVYSNFKTTRTYIGENGVNKDSLGGRMRTADLVTRCMMTEAATQQIEHSGIAVDPQTRIDKIHYTALELEQEYGPRMHKILVDFSLLKETK